MNTSPKINRKTRTILQQLSGLSLSDLLKLLSQIISQLLKKVESSDSYQKPIFKMNKNFLPRHRGQKSTVESDPEMQAFIDGISEYKTYDEIRELCVEKFGEDCVPSRSAIGRYILKVRKIKEQEQGNNE